MDESSYVWSCNLKRKHSHMLKGRLGDVRRPRRPSGCDHCGGSKSISLSELKLYTISFFNNEHVSQRSQKSIA